MQVLGDLIPLTNGEVFDIIRRNREQRNIKSLPHFHAQSIGSITGSSAHQALAVHSRFADKDAIRKQRENRANELVTLIQPSVLASGSKSSQPHNTGPHTEVKLLHYLQRERDFYGPTSVLMRRFEENPDYNDSDEEEDDRDDAEISTKGTTGVSAVKNENKVKSNQQSSSSAATLLACNETQIKDSKILEILTQMKLREPTPLAEIAKQHHDKIEQGLAEYGSSPFPEGSAAVTTPPPSDPTVPSLFYHESTRDNVVHLDHCLACLRDHGQDKTRRLLANLKEKTFCGKALANMLLFAWDEQSKADKKLFFDFVQSFSSSGGASVSECSVDKSTMERGIAKRLSNCDGNTAASTVGLSTLAAASLYTPKTTPQDLAILSSSGLPVTPLVLRNLVDLRHFLTSPAHIAAVITNEMAFIGDLAEFILRYEAVRAAEQHYYESIIGGGGGANNTNGSSDAFSSSSSSTGGATSAVKRFIRFPGGVEDGALVVPQAIVEGFRYSAVMALCNSVLDSLSAFR